MRLPFALIPLLLLFHASICIAQQTAIPRHLVEAKDLVEHLDLAQTNYEHGEGKVIWRGVRESHTDCSGFVDALLTHTYGYQKEDYKKWFDSHRPSARRYHDAIVEGRGFDLVERVNEIRPGDFLAVKYLQKKDNTGHIMLVSDAARRIVPKQPFVESTEQWEITVIDSSQSGHGPTDSRHGRGIDGKDHAGLGHGILRLYTDSKSSVRGFTWSTYGNSHFKSPDEEHLVIGRLKPDFHP